MVIGLYTVELRFPDSHSLKAKRQILSSVKTRMQGQLNVSVAEVDAQDRWQTSVMAIVTVANASTRVHQVLDHALNMLHANPALEVLDARRELL